MTSHLCGAGPVQGPGAPEQGLTQRQGLPASGQTRGEVGDPRPGPAQSPGGSRARGPVSTRGRRAIGRQAGGAEFRGEGGRIPLLSPAISRTHFQISNEMRRAWHLTV